MLRHLFLVLCCFHGTIACLGEADRGAENAEQQNFQVNSSFTQTAFSYTRTLVRQQKRHRVYRLTYPSPVLTEVASNNTIPAEYYQPALGLAMILGGGNLQDILLTAAETKKLADFYNRLPPQQQQVVDRALQKLDPLTHVAAIKPLASQGRVLMINAENDTVITPACTRQLARALGMEENVSWLEGLGHYTAMAALPEIVNELVPFFAQDLPNTAIPAATALEEPSAQAVFSEFLQSWIHSVTDTCVYALGAAYSIRDDDWFFTRMDEVLERTRPHIPVRFLQEIEALSRSANISLRDAQVANLIPEMFHCSGVAVRNTATKTGNIIQARVLDYMREINLTELLQFYRASFE